MSEKATIADTPDGDPRTEAQCHEGDTNVERLATAVESLNGDEIMTDRQFLKLASNIDAFESLVENSTHERAEAQCHVGDTNVGCETAIGEAFALGMFFALAAEDA